MLRLQGLLCLSGLRARRIYALRGIGHHNRGGYMLLRIYRFRLRSHYGGRSQEPTAVHPNSDRRVVNNRLLRVLWSFRSAHYRATILRTKCQSTVSAYVSRDGVGLGQVVRDGWSD